VSLTYPVATQTLDNGLRVVVSEDHLVPRVSVNLWVDVGSRHEEAGHTGLAHLFEHLMFEGSAQVAEGEHFRELMGHGGHANATTSFDRTTYLSSVPTGALELALWLEADRHTDLLPAVTQANLDNQRDVVVEEKRQRYDNQPYGDAFQQMCTLVFPPAHPYRHTPIGDMTDLREATLEDVHTFYEDHYGPSTTVLTLVGDIRPDHAFALAERYFGGAADRTVPRRPPAAPLAPLSQVSRRVVEGEVPSVRSYTCFRLPAVTHPDFPAVSVATDVLAGLAVSSLHQRLVRQEESATACGGGALGLVDGTSFGYVVVDVAEGHHAHEVEDALCEEVLALARRGPTSGQLGAALAQAERSYLEALAATDERAEMLARATVVHGDPEHLNTYPDLVAAVTADDVARVVEQWLAPDARALLVYRSDSTHPDRGVS
jgi:zinc protease